MENLEKEEKPWEKDMQHLAGAIEGITEAVRMMMKNNSTATKPVSTSPAQPAEPQKTESEILAEKINAGTAAITGKQTTSTAVVSAPAPVNEADKEAESQRIASMIIGGTEKIVSDARDQQIRDLTAQLAETQKMLSMKK